MRRFTRALVACGLAVSALGAAPARPVGPAQAEGARAAFEAVQAGDVARIGALLRKDPELARVQGPDGQTLTHLAVNAGTPGLLAFLLENGAPVDPRDREGTTPLFWAAGRDLGMVRLLVEKGADIEAEDRPGMTSVLMMAAAGTDPRIVEYLLGRGARVRSPEAGQNRRLMESAAQNGHRLLLDRMIAQGVPVTGADAAGGNLLHRAAAGGVPSVVETLVRAGLPVSGANIYGWTPLHFAAERGHREAAAFLLDRGAGLDARTIEGKTAYNLAVEWNHPDVAGMLAERGADRGGPRFPAVEGPYFGQEPPGPVPAPFAVGLVASRYNFHGNVTFSPDGREAYWSVMNFGQDRDWAILSSRRVDGRWTLPGLASFSSVPFHDDVPFVSPDGKKLLFVSRRPLSEGAAPGKENVWMLERAGEGWSAPRPLPPAVNSVPHIHWQVSTDLRGDLYFGATAEGGLGAMDIYVSRLENGTYGAPSNLGAAINGPGDEFSPFVAPDGSYLIFTRDANLWLAFRAPDGGWTPARDLSDIVKVRGVSICPIVSPDGKHLFFLGSLGPSNEPYWMDAGFIEALKRDPSAGAAPTKGKRP